MFRPILAEQDSEIEQEIMLPASQPQKILRSFQTDFAFHHDKGIYLCASLGPQWNQSLQYPKAKGMRFGGKFALGWFVADNLAIIMAGWGHFLEAASLLAGGPGVSYLFDGPNIGIDLSLGVGQAFAALNGDKLTQFRETVLAAHLSLAKYWWLSEKSSLGVSLDSGLHGLTLSRGNINTFGWSLGAGLAFLFG
jgi:hypothetical protein